MKKATIKLKNDYNGFIKFEKYEKDQAEGINRYLFTVNNMLIAILREEKGLEVVFE